MDGRRQLPPCPVITPWLGTFERRPERVARLWISDGRQLGLGRVIVPVDDGWHETVLTFFVRYRAVWLAARQVLLVEERHNLGPVWRFEVRPAPDGQRLLKVARAAIYTEGTP